MSGRRPATIYYVIDDADWSIFWDGRYISEGLRDRHGLNAERVRQIGQVHGQIVHFGSRYGFFHPSCRSLHRTNRLFLTWFHGTAQDPALAPYFDRLPGLVGEIERIVVPCRLTLDPLIEAGVPGNMIEIIPLGVDLAHFRPASGAEKAAIRREMGIPDGALVVGSFQKDGSGWGEGMEPKWVKAPEVFLDAISMTAKALPNLFVLLTGPARGYVKAGLERIGVPYLHRMLDDYRAIVRYYQALDLYVIASRSEGGPKALLESWACGVPLTSTRVGMCADLMEDGINGVMVEQEDSTGLAEGSLRLIQDSRFRDGVVAAGLERVSAYDWNHIADRYMNKLYAPILGG